MNTNKLKIYIAGCGGMLGEGFYKQFQDDYQLKCTDIDVNADWLSYLDFRDYHAYRSDVHQFKPNWLFHLGAFTDLEYCELNPDKTYQTNTESVKHGVRIAKELKIPLLYISTAGIFNGKKEFYDESDIPDPICHYARSKYLGEKYVQEHADEYLICRAGWMMGGGPQKDKKFVQKLLHQVHQGATKLFVVNDKLGTPTYTHDFAKNVKLLIKEERRGLFNMVCEGLTSRLMVAKELISLAGLTERIQIVEVSSDHFKKEYFVHRPDSERLINRRLNDLGLNVMRDWKVAIKQYIQDYYLNYLS